MKTKSKNKAEREVVFADPDEEHEAVSVELPSQVALGEAMQVRCRNFLLQEQEKSHSDHSPQTDHDVVAFVVVEFAVVDGAMIESLLMDCFLPLLLNNPVTVQPSLVPNETKTPLVHMAFSGMHTGVTFKTLLQSL